jgi:hypothetical protein
MDQRNTTQAEVALISVVMASLYHLRSSARSHTGPCPTLKPQALFKLLTRSDTIGCSVKLVVKGGPLYVCDGHWGSEEHTFFFYSYGLD